MLMNYNKSGTDFKKLFGTFIDYDLSFWLLKYVT